MKNSKILLSYCKSSLDVLNSKFNLTKNISHSVTAGIEREQIIKDFLSEHLPKLISVISGQIIDSNNNYSKQQDIVLVLKSMPDLFFSSRNYLIFCEGVVCTLEIKTSLNSNVLRKVGENIKSVRALSSRQVTSTAMGITHSWPLNKILTSIVTYGGTGLKLLMDELAGFEDSSKPDLILNLNKGILIKNNDLLVPKDGNTEYLLIEDPAQGFMYFLTFLTEITGTLASRGINWRKYW